MSHPVLPRGEGIRKNRMGRDIFVEAGFDQPFALCICCTGKLSNPELKVCMRVCLQFSGVYFQDKPGVLESRNFSQKLFASSCVHVGILFFEDTCPEEQNCPSCLFRRSTETIRGGLRSGKTFVCQTNHLYQMISIVESHTCRDEFNNHFSETSPTSQTWFASSVRPLLSRSGSHSAQFRPRPTV